jgi:hypothetical protein
MASPEFVKDTIEALYRPIEGVVKAVAGPAAGELALLFQDVVKEYRLRRWVRCLKRTQKLFADAGINAKAVKPMLLFELLDGASLEDDDDLQDVWANLLANAADSRGQVLVRMAFPRILREISREEAQYLLEMLEVKKKTAGYIPETYAEAGDESDIPEGEPPSGKLDSVSYDNLLRLRLIGPNEDLLPVEPLNAGTNQYKFLTDEPFLLTALGEAFVIACSVPQIS